MPAPNFVAGTDECARPSLWCADGRPCLAGAVTSGTTGGVSAVGAAGEGAAGAAGDGAVGGAACAAGGAAGVGTGTGVGVTAGTGVGVGISLDSPTAVGPGTGGLRRCRASQTPPAAPRTTPTIAKMSVWLGRLREGRSLISDAAASAQPRGTNSVSDPRSTGPVALSAARACAPPISRVKPATEPWLDAWSGPRQIDTASRNSAMLW